MPRNAKKRRREMVKGKVFYAIKIIPTYNTILTISFARASVINKELTCTS